MVVEPSREPPKLKPALLSRSGIAPKLSGPTLGNLGKARGLVEDCKPTLAGSVLGITLDWEFQRLCSLVPARLWRLRRRRLWEPQ